MRTNINNIKGKKVLIVGLGKSGTATCRTLLDIGAEVSVQDRSKESDFDPSFLNYLRGRGVSFYFDSLPPDMGEFDMMVLSPGVSAELPFVTEAKEKGVEVIGELEIAYRASKGNFVAITGTNGKTTTTTLTGQIFKLAGRKTHIVGNIGTAATMEAYEAGEDDWLVTEASSFQLETIKYFRPVVSAILNLTPDHLNRHHTMEAYGAAKARVFENQTESGYLVINYDDKDCYKLSKDCKAQVIPFSRKEELDRGCFVRDGKIVIRDQGKDIEICAVDELKIIGDHNVENVLAASAISYFAGIDPEAIRKGVTNFAGVEHRIEYCAYIDGVKYYNDSKGTNIDAALTAVRAFKENIVLIAGGDAKGQVFEGFVKEIKPSIKALILLGRDGKLIGDAAAKEGIENIIYCKDIPECVSKAHEIAQSGDTVLLSPACASWDMYDNYEQRGDHFRECVERFAK